MPLVDIRDTGRLVRNYAAGVNTVNLYDPPIGGATPLNGAGEPRTSVIPERDVEPKLAQGFTQEPVVAAPTSEEEAGTKTWVENEKAPKRPRKR